MTRERWVVEVSDAGVSLSGGASHFDWRRYVSEIETAMHDARAEILSSRRRFRRALWFIAAEGVLIAVLLAICAYLASGKGADPSIRPANYLRQESGMGAGWATAPAPDFWGRRLANQRGVGLAYGIAVDGSIPSRSHPDLSAVRA